MSEWSVLESIHPTICIANENSIVSLCIPVELGTDTPLFIVPVDHDTYLASASCSVPAHGPALSAALPVLPPLHFRIALPPSYPSQAAPVIQSLRATSAWLSPPTLALIKDRLTAMWSPGDDAGVLYTWVEWIRTGDFLAEIGLLANDMHSIQIPHPSPQLLLALLLAFASSCKSDEFAHSSHLCAICLSERKGAHCLALSCRHVFCRTCLADMWGLHVKEGQVSQVCCPKPKCGSGDVYALREATEDEVRAVLSESEVSRWKWLRKKRDLERDPTMIHCPMAYCQEPVLKPKPDSSTTGDSDPDESGWARLRTCPACSYAFCAFCRRTWHGPHTSCPFPLTSKFALEYLSASPDSPERHAIERRYGRNNILKLMKQQEEEQESWKWMDSSTTTCPGCEVRVEKSMGCNHMTCAKCGTHFCYRCGTRLPAASPYQHFSTPHTPCFSKLFDLDAEDEWQGLDII